MMTPAVSAQEDAKMTQQTSTMVNNVVTFVPSLLLVPSDRYMSIILV